MTSIIDTVTTATARGAAVRPVIGGFPYLAEAMRQAGITMNYFDVPSQSMVFVTDDGDVLQPGSLLHSEPTIMPPFDEAGLITALRADQQGRSTFPEFVRATFCAGVVRYEVDLIARTCTYVGARGERYVENYPAVELPPPESTSAGVERLYG
ncbi:DUF1398 family protein [Gordonia insulae]|uniref:DUF1398 domain-containing protein n=1 Tax=Gordonia insulae TaxID=2420509 RepID=A0A3G8JNL8_9ACTN|nr:DUF1398 family protein [Gordonia insulae]AZG46681.1 hypothetical protein D7316_03282 [Gordonia insulae]